jgi:ABC-type polysaccharide/polyol phosphate export permease
MAVASEAPASYRSSAARPGALQVIADGFREVLSRRRLIRYLVRADLKKKGADTLLGNVWWVVDPLLQMLIYVVLVALVFARATPDFPLFLFCAILPWKWFASSLMDGISSVVSMEKLIKQINFPKIVLPVAGVFAGVANFFFGLIPLFALMILFFPHRITPWVVLIPVVAAVQLVMTLPLAILLGAANIFYRDVGNLARHALRLAFYASPGIYSVELLQNAAEKYPVLQPFIVLNPWTTLFGAYRDIIYEGRAPNWAALGVLAVISILLLTVAILIFKRLEPSFAKIL